MKLLIVEDEVKTAEYLQKGLTEQGCTVDIAHDALTIDAFDPPHSGPQFSTYAVPPSPENTALIGRSNTSGAPYGVPVESVLSGLCA